MKTRNRLLALLMTMTLVLTYMPAIAFAAEGEEPGDNDGAPVAVEQEQAESENDGTEAAENAADDEQSTEAVDADSESGSEDTTEASEESGDDENAEETGESEDSDNELTLTEFKFTTDYEYKGYIGSSQLVEWFGHEGEEITLTFKDKSGEIKTAVYKYTETDEDGFVRTDDSPIECPKTVDLSWAFVSDSQEKFEEGSNDIQVFDSGLSSDVTSGAILVEGVKVPAKMTSVEYDYNGEEPLQAYVGTKDVWSLNSTWPAEGDKVTIHYEDGNTASFVFDSDRYDFIDEGGKRLERDYDCWWGLSFKERTTEYAQGSNVINFELLDGPTAYLSDEEDWSNFYVYCDLEVEGVQSEVQSIEFIPVKTLEFEREEGEKDKLEYDPFKEGDQLIVNYKDGSSITYIYTRITMYDEEGNIEDTDLCFVDKTSERSIETPIDYYDNQETDPWIEGLYSYFVNYQGAEYEVKEGVKVTKIAHVHEWDEDDIEEGYPPTCTEDGRKASWYCYKCKKYFADEEGKEEIAEDDLVIPKTGHKEGDPVREDETDATCVDEGMYVEVIYCEVCDEEISRETKIIPATGEHDWGEWETVDEPTEESTGLERRICSVCEESEERDIPVLDHTHVAVKVEEVAATCEEDGVKAHYECEKCGKLFEDEDASQTVTEEDLVIEALGHDYGEPTYEWTDDNSEVTATVVCSRDESHVATETVETASEVKTPATCTAKGTTTYTAEFENSVFETQTKDVEDIPVDANAHDWDEGTVTKEPTCTEAGEKTVTCKNDPTHTDTEEVAALGHDWDEPTYEWADDNSKITAKRVCKNDATHVETEEVETTSEVTKPATCEGKGETTYTAEFKNEGFETQSKTEENIDPIGHDWGEPTYEWADDNSKVTAKRVCKNDASHVETEDAETTSEVTRPATCEDKGETTYTPAAFTKDVFEQQEAKTVEDIDALGHDWDEGKVTKEPTCTEKGEKFLTCKRDSEHTKTEEVAVLGHDWSAWSVVKAATTTSEGQETRKCSRCNEEETRTISKIVEPAKVGVPSISTEAKQGKKKMTVSWGKVSGASKYVVAYRKAGKGWTTKTTTKTSYVVKKLKKKGLYEFKVAAVSSSGVQGEWSKVSYRYFFGKNPTLRRGKGAVTVKWAKDKNATGYQVMYSTNKNMSGAQIVTIGSKNTTRYKISGLKKGQRVYVRIRPMKGKYRGVLTNRKSAKAK